MMISVLNFIFEELVAVFQSFAQLKNKKRILKYFKLTFQARKRVFLDFGKLQRISKGGGTICCAAYNIAR